MISTWATHEVRNQHDDWCDANLLDADPALDEAIARGGAAWQRDALWHHAGVLGRSWQLAGLANRHLPELQRFDARGRRVDVVQFHPAWHQLLEMARQQGLVSLPFDNERPGRWTAWAAGFYLHAQVEHGSLCPTSMSMAAIPLLQKEPALWQALEGKLYSRVHDARDVPLADKPSMWLGMGMTEKQGGSDVRANATLATPLGMGGRGGEYLLRGHKWFFSAPMCDAHLVTARVDGSGEGGGGAFACFYVPRWRPDGSRNAVRIEQLKDKVGNRSNSSSEVEFEDAWGILMGEEGRGIPTIIEMATCTRLACVLGSGAILRAATVQATAYARRRMAFGRNLADQPLMRSVLADLALESEAAQHLGMHLARIYERDQDAQQAGRADPVAHAWKRIMTPAAKFWVCKRTVELVGEALEVFGGNGYVESGIMARLYREAPVNSVWEGSGNVMCLDVLRALAREPQSARLLLQDLMDMAAGDGLLHEAALALVQRLDAPAQELEAGARRLVQDLVLLAQACLLRHQAPQAVADGFVSTRLGHRRGAQVVGAFDPGALDVAAILRRALPQ